MCRRIRNTPTLSSLELKLSSLRHHHIPIVPLDLNPSFGIKQE